MSTHNELPSGEVFAIIEEPAAKMVGSRRSFSNPCPVRGPADSGRHSSGGCREGYVQERERIRCRRYGHDREHASRPLDDDAGEFRNRYLDI